MDIWIFGYLVIFILDVCLISLSDEFAQAQGLYFDNDEGRFAAPHPDALDPHKNAQVIQVIEKFIAANN